MKRSIDNFGTFFSVINILLAFIFLIFPIIVAINKIDLPTADPDKVRKDLLSQEIIVEKLDKVLPSLDLK